MKHSTIDHGGATGAPGLSHRDAMGLQERELHGTIEMLATFEVRDWSMPTDCPEWDVRQMYLHVLGACEAAASLRENAHQMLAARRHQRGHGGPLEAALSAVQVRERIGLEPSQLIERLRSVAPKAIRRRTKLPPLIRRVSLAVDGPVIERWTLGYLNDTIYLRDLWMHRVDAVRAAGRPLELRPDHDGVIVADVVAEWMRRHGQPCILTLLGPAGGCFSSTVPPTGDQPVTQIELDAVEFCRILAGRAEGAGLLGTIVPF